MLEKSYRLSADFVATPRLCVAILAVLRQANDWQRDLRTRCFTFQKESTVETSDWSSRSRSDVVHRRNTRREDEDAVDRDVERRHLGEDFRGGGEGEVGEDFRPWLHEEAGRINDAASVMQEVAIETYGALSKRESVFYRRTNSIVHEERRLRASEILSKKINVRSFDEIKRLEEKEMLKKKKKMEEEGGADAMVMDEDEKKRFEEVEKEEKKEKESAVQHAKACSRDGSSVPGFTHVAFELLQVNGSIFRKEKKITWSNVDVIRRF